MMPTARHLTLLAGLCLIALLSDIFLAPVAMVYTLIIFYLLWAGSDLLRLWQLPGLQLQRQLDANIPVREWVDASLLLTLEHGRPQRLLLEELRDALFECDGLPAEVWLQAGQQATLNYRLRANRRGSFAFQAVQYRLFSPAGFWSRKRTVPLPQPVRVQPNYQAVVNMTLQGEEQAVARMGLRLQRRRGEGTEFHQLREYRAGDAIRKIDWKATSRARKLISKEFRDEQDQQLVFLLDTGRRMRHSEAGSNFMDDTINAMLLVSHIAARQGDAVGFMAFGNHQHWCPPQKHKSIVKQLVDHCFDIQPGLVHSDYLRSAQRLLELQKRRALVVILTNTRDEDSEDLEKAMVLLRKRHLVAIADLQEDFFSHLEQQDFNHSEQALTYLATQQYQQSRQQMQRSLTGLGAVYLDCVANNLPARLVGAYQQIKSSGRL